MNRITFDGRTQSKSAWARELGISTWGLTKRLRSLPVPEALTLPKRPGKWFRPGQRDDTRTASLRSGKWARPANPTLELRNAHFRPEFRIEA